jgi:hypothetical protein
VQSGEGTVGRGRQNDQPQGQLGRRRRVHRHGNRGWRTAYARGPVT